MMRDAPERAEFASAFGGTAEIERPLAPIVSDAIDPSLPFDDQFCCDAQQRFRVAMW